MKDKKFFFSLPVLLFCLSPLLVLFYYFNFDTQVPTQDLAMALKNSSIQSLSAALICISIGLALAASLSRSINQITKWMLQLSLLPSILPSIFTILIIFSYFKQFPFGHVGVVLIFTVTYLGFAIVALTQAFQVGVLKYSDQLQIYNVPLAQRLLKIYIPLLKKDIFNIFLIITLGCFSSLSVPLLAGGGRSTNIEVLIYETIFINGQWGAAVYISLAQLGIIFLMSFCLGRQNNLSNQISFKPEASSIWSWGFIALSTYVAVYVLGYFVQVIRALQSPLIFTFDWAEFISPMGRSFALAFLSIAFFLFFTISLIYFSYRRIKYQYLFYFMLPSTTLVGFAAYLVFPEVSGNFLDILKIAICFNLVYSLAIYKSYIHPVITQLESQLSVSSIYELSFSSVLRSVIYPQIKKVIWIGINILFLFSFCEFALIKAAGTQNLFTGVFIERLISNYRLELGFLCSFIVLVNSALFLKATEFLNVEN